MLYKSYIINIYKSSSNIQLDMQIQYEKGDRF